MLIRVVSGGTMRVLELDDVSHLTVFTADGDPVVVASENTDRAVIAGHAGEKDFRDLLRKQGIRAKRAPEII